MTNEQKKHLKVRLMEANQLRRAAIPSRWDSMHTPPMKVLEARRKAAKLNKIVHAWARKLEREHDKATAALEREHREAMTALLFHDPQKALAAVIAFERKVK